MQLQNMEARGVLQVPYICYRCGGRSSDPETLEAHIRNEHGRTQVARQIFPDAKEEPSDDEEDEVRQMLLNNMVEVQIKEEPEFLTPLDLSRKDDPLGHAVWIKQEPPTDYDFMEEEEVPYPRVRVASEAFLKPPVAPATPVLLNFPLRGAPPPPLYSFVEKGPRASLTKNNHLPMAKTGRPLPLLVPISRVNLLVPRPSGPPPRMPTTFPQAPYLITVPYTCYHCGGRSPDLETLKTHIMTMHNPEAIHRQKLALEAKKNQLPQYASSVKLNIPKAQPKPPKDKVIKVPKEIKKEEKKAAAKEKISVKKEEKPYIIKVPKVPLRSEAVEKKLKEKAEKAKNWRYKCPHCEFGGDSFRGLILHAKTKHEQERARKRKEEAERTGIHLTNMLYCLFCDYKSRSQPALKKHTNAIHAKEKNHKCPYCAHSSAYPENLRWHLSNKHKFKCPHCEYRSTTKKDLVDHEENSCPAYWKGRQGRGSAGGSGGGPGAASRLAPPPAAPVSTAVATGCQTSNPSEESPPHSPSLATSSSLHNGGAGPRLSSPTSPPSDTNNPHNECDNDSDVDIKDHSIVNSVVQKLSNNENVSDRNNSDLSSGVNNLKSITSIKSEIDVSVKEEVS